MELFTIFTLLACCVFLSGVEITFTAADRLRLELELQKNNLRSRFLSLLLANPDRWLATTLVLFNAFLVVLAIQLAHWLHTHLYPELTDIYLIEILDISIITVVVLIFVEIIPKTLFQIAPTQTLIWLSLPIYGLQWIFRPVVSLFMWINYQTLALFNIRLHKEQKQRFGKKDLEHFLHNIHDQTGIDQEILHNALELNELTARGCMTELGKVLAVELNTSMAQLTELFIEYRFTRIVIYEQKKEQIVGYFHHHYLLQNPKNIAQYLFPTQTVLDTYPAQDLLHKMIAEKLNMVVVVNKEKKTLGIIALSDLLTMLFGKMDEQFETE